MEKQFLNKGNTLSSVARKRTFITQKIANDKLKLETKLDMYLHKLQDTKDVGEDAYIQVYMYIYILDVTYMAWDLLLWH